MSLQKNTFLLAVVLLALVVLIPYWRLTLMQGIIITDDIFTSDIMNDAYPLRAFLGEVLRSGHAPLWIPHIYGGFPLLARAEAGVCYPLNILFFGLLSPHVALNIIILLTLIIAAVSMFLYVREIGGNVVASLIGGVAFSFSGYMVSHLKHLSNVNAACWLPLGLWLIERALQRRDAKYLWLVAVIFGLQHLSGHTQVAYYSGVLYIAYYFFRYRSCQKESARQKNAVAVPLYRSRLSLVFLGAMIFGSGFGAIQLLPTYELVSLSQRAGGVTFDYASQYAYDPKNLLMFFYPYVNGDIGDGTYRGTSIFWEDYGYVGITVILAAFYAVVRLRKSWYVKFFSISALVSIIFVLGPNTPVYEAVFHVVPGMKYFRFPTRFLLAADLSLIVLACIGLTQIIGRFDKRAPNGKGKSTELFPKAGVAALLLVVADLWYFQLRQNPIVDLDRWLVVPKTAELIKMRTQESSWRESQFRVFVIGGNESHKMAFARARGWQGDLQPYVNQREFLQPSSNVLYGLHTPDGYANFTPNYVVDVWGDQNRAGLVFATASVRDNMFHPTPAFRKLMNMFNVKFLLSLWPIAHAGEFENLGKIHDVFVYENPAAFPRAYLVGKTKVVRTVEEAKRMLTSGEFDPKKEVLLYESIELSVDDGAGAGTVMLKDYSPNVVEFHVSAASDAVLVFSDSYYPGWKVEVDGKHSQILQANVTHRAVVIPPGEHSVRFLFAPQSVNYGLWLTGGSFAVFIGILLIRTIMRKGPCR